jgi:HK97 family phage prohead protease
MGDLIYITSRRAEPKTDAVARTIPFRLSNAVQDRAGDTVSLSGWKLENYLANPIILWGHDHDLPSIGRMARLGLEGDWLVGDVTFATKEQHPFADTIFRLVDGGFINAGSVGFKPLRWAYREKDGGIDWLEQELLEYSICNIPMHPGALARAVARGVDIAPLADAVGAKNTGSYADLVSKLLASNTPAPHQSTHNVATLRNQVAHRKLRSQLA